MIFSICYTYIKELYFFLIKLIIRENYKIYIKRRKNMEITKVKTNIETDVYLFLYSYKVFLIPV